MKGMGAQGKAVGVSPEDAERRGAKTSQEDKMAAAVGKREKEREPYATTRVT